MVTCSASLYHHSWRLHAGYCWKVNFKDFEWLKTQTSANGHLSAYIYPVVLVLFDLYRLRLKHVPIIA
jgi:hypothetical protein